MNKIISTQKRHTQLLLDQLTQETIGTLPHALTHLITYHAPNSPILTTLQSQDPIANLYLLYHLNLLTSPIHHIDQLANWYTQTQKSPLKSQ